MSSIIKREMMRVSDEQMDLLISHIKEQSSKLNKNLTDCLKSADKSNERPPRAFQGGFTPKISKTGSLATPAATSPSGDRSEFEYTKGLMDNLLMDNRMLHEDIDDFKKALHQIMNKYRELKVNSTQRELELEKLKNMRIEFLEQQMKREKEKSHKLILQNIRLKEKYLELINKLRQNLYEYTEDEKEDNILLEQLVRENRHLRELLAISKLSDPKVRDIETALLTEEKSMNQMSIEQYREQLMAYKQERESRKRSKSMADIKSKNFLVGVQSEHSSGSDVWSSFFKKHETGAASSLF